MHDLTTLRFYAQEAEHYAARYSAASSSDLPAFMARLPAVGAVLELGCGGGQDAAVMLACGHAVTVTDGSPEMADEASKRLRYPVQVMRFDELDHVDLYDGVWASACLLHVPLTDLPAVLTRIFRALHSGGWFYASFKAGEGEGRDRFGRFYNYPSKEQLRAAYQRAAPWRSIAIEEQTGSGYDQQPTRWLEVTAQA